MRTENRWCVSSAGEVTAVMESFLKDNLLELREALWNNKFCITREGQGAFSGPHLGHFGAPAPFGPPISGEHSVVCDAASQALLNVVATGVPCGFFKQLIISAA
jgi:hypothetical protein